MTSGFWFVAGAWLGFLAGVLTFAPLYKEAHAGWRRSVEGWEGTIEALGKANELIKEMNRSS